MHNKDSAYCMQLILCIVSVGAWRAGRSSPFSPVSLHLWRLCCSHWVMQQLLFVSWEVGEGEAWRVRHINY